MLAPTISSPKPYEPRGAAKELWSLRAPEVLLDGPAGTGKTRAILEKVLALACKYRGSRHLICRKTRAAMTQSVLVTFETKVLPPGSRLLTGADRKYRQSYVMPFLTGEVSEIVVGGLDNPERTFSTEYDTVSVFEATETTENEWESLHRALRNNQMPYQQAIADCNPTYPLHWLNQRASTKKMVRLKSRHEDNPLLFNQKTGQWTELGRTYVLGTLENLSGHLKQRLRHGKWVSAEGIVYEEFDPRHHFKVGSQAVSLRTVCLNHMRLVASVDWGFVKPGVMQLWAISGDGNMYRVLEHYHTKWKIGRWTQKAKIWQDRHGIEAFVCDPSEPGYIQEFLEAGLPAVEAYNDIHHGIQNIQERMKTTTTGEPRMYFLEDSLVERDEQLANTKHPFCTEMEFDAYTWKVKKDGKPDTKEKPIDEYNHGMDAMRYAAAYVDNLKFAQFTPGASYAGVA